MLIPQMLQRNALNFASRKALSHEHRERTWQDLAISTAKYAELLSQHGVGKRTRVGVIALNSDRYVETFFALSWLGAVIVPMNSRWAYDEHKYAVDDSSLTHLIVDDTFHGVADAITGDAKSIKAVFNIGENKHPKAIDVYRELERYHGIPPASYDINSLAGIYYTGGTTGFPKGVMLSTLNFWSSAMATVTGYKLNAQPVSFQHALPFFHIAGTAGFLACSLVGASQYFTAVFVPEKLIDDIERNQVSHLMLVPTMIAMMLDDKSFKPKRLESLRQVIYGASPILESTLTKVLAELPNIEFYQGYGQTEAAPAISILGPDEHKSHHSKLLRSAGKACDCVAIRIVDSKGKDAALGEAGEVVVSGPNVMLGYLNKRKETEDAVKNGWLYTGDIGYLDAEGYLFLLDRAKDMIVTGAENVYSAEVETAISTCPGVDSVAVIGVPHDKWGEAVHAVIVTREPLTFDDVIAHCRTRIAGFKCPKTIEFRQTPLPLSPAGKILKTELRQAFQSQSAKSA